MCVGTFLGVHLLTPAGAEPPAPSLIAASALNLACLVLAWGAIAMLVASLSKRQSSVTAICGLLAFIAFVIDYVARIWSRLDFIAHFSPFHYFSPFDMFAGRGLSWTDVAVLAGVFVAAWIAAGFVYARRDL